jgi:hypothetical protein
MNRLAQFVLLLTLITGLPAATRKASSAAHKSPAPASRSKPSVRQTAGTATKRTAVRFTSSSSSRNAKLLQHASYSRGRSTRWNAVVIPREPARQLTPSEDRYKEIQQALSRQGYLQGEPTGFWDDASQEALRRFQTDHELDPTGKLSARSLITLGLGPSEPEVSPLTLTPVKPFVPIQQ